MILPSSCVLLYHNRCDNIIVKMCIHFLFNSFANFLLHIAISRTGCILFIHNGEEIEKTKHKMKSRTHTVSSSSTTFGNCFAQRQLSQVLFITFKKFKSMCLIPAVKLVTSTSVIPPARLVKTEEDPNLSCNGLLVKRQP